MSTTALMRRVERIERSTSTTARSTDPDAARAFDDLGAFASEMLNVSPAAHHRLLITELEAIERGENNRLMVFMPPGSGKSTYASVAFPALVSRPQPEQGDYHRELWPAAFGSVWPALSQHRGPAALWRDLRLRPGVGQFGQG